ncbi:MATE family efflux transporter [Bradyrhizobium sp. CCGUVB1N3]|uniref:MATE family efflux transporter n=1 Tax=Bradyrhizobium sp. CCGUVB1N3 TaxID=2949629 RepID=UPI003532339A
MEKITGTNATSRLRYGLPRWMACHHLAVELSETARLAFPMALTQLGQIAMMTTDLAFIGRIGAEAMAAAVLAGTVLSISLTFASGVVSAVAPLSAQAFGAANPALVARCLRTGFWAALLLWMPMMAFPLYGEELLLALSSPPETARLAQQYLFGLAWGALPAMWFSAVRSFMAAINRPEPALWITLVAIPINALLVFLLVCGQLGLPQLGLLGVGLATTMVNCATFLTALWFVTKRRPFHDYHVLADLWRLDWPLMRQLFGVGTPISMAILIESGFFSASAFLVAATSTTALAAHQIAVQVATILLMIPFGISMAATVRVGHAAGRNDVSAVKRAGLVAMLFGVAITAVVTLAVIAARFEIAELFLGESSINAGATIGLAAELLLVGASFFVTDAVQSIAAGSLHGLKDTRVPLLFAGIAYWLVGLSLSYLLGLKMGLGAIGIWIGLSIGTAVYAALLVMRLWRLTSRLVFTSDA